MSNSSNSQSCYLSNSVRVHVLFAVFAFFICISGAARAQSALDGFDPNANGVVRVVVVQPDGKILIGGDFTTVSPNGAAAVPRNRIARLNPDGTLDTGFNPNASGTVRAIAVQADGRVLAGGNFAAIGGQLRENIARLDATTGIADLTFNPNANMPVYEIVVQPDGNILVGGQFINIGGQLRPYIARLDAATGLADPFVPFANNTVRSIKVQSDGKILIGGDFTTLNVNVQGTVTRNRIARMNADGTLDNAFNPNANDTVHAIAVQVDGKVLAAGAFAGANSIGGQTRNHIARLDAITGAADAFDPNTIDNVYSVVMQTDGKILVGGAIGGFFPNGGGLVIRNRMARLNTDGTVDGFHPNTNADVLTIAVQQDGKVLLGGDFTLIGGSAGETRNFIGRVENDGKLDQTLINPVISDGDVRATVIQRDGKILIGGDFTLVQGLTRNGIARLNRDGTLDTAFNPNANGDVRSIAVQSDGKILAGGAFSTIGGQPRNNFARLDAATGIADVSFDPNANSIVYAIAVQTDGKIVVGGFFNNIGGQTRSRIARLDAVSGLADSFNPDADGYIRTIAVQSDGKILAGGGFTTIGGQPRSKIARLDGATGLADSFDPNPNEAVFSIAVQSDGKVLAGGQFTTIGVQTRNGMARMNADGTLDSAFDPNVADGYVLSIAVQSDGKVLAGGAFFNIGGQMRNHFARLDAATGLADSFDPNPNGGVNSIALQSDGKILASGFFNNIGGQTRTRFARLLNDTAALSTLTVTRTTLTLTRNGSGPQFPRVIFEQSINNGATYTLLGTATNSFASVAAKDKVENAFAPQAAGYTLTGQNIPTGQNVLIRARGFYRTGINNGSETTEDKVQTAFFVGPTAASVSVSGRVSTAGGRGVGNAIVTLTDSQGVSQRAITSSFGYYRFDEVQAGETYTISVSSKRYQFAPRVVSVVDELTDIDFVAESGFRNGNGLRR